MGIISDTHRDRHKIGQATRRQSDAGKLAAQRADEIVRRTSVMTELFQMVDERTAMVNEIGGSGSNSNSDEEDLDYSTKYKTHKAVLEPTPEELEAQQEEAAQKAQAVREMEQIKAAKKNKRRRSSLVAKQQRRASLEKAPASPSEDNQQAKPSPPVSPTKKAENCTVTAEEPEALKAEEPAQSADEPHPEATLTPPVKDAMDHEVQVEVPVELEEPGPAPVPIDNMTGAPELTSTASTTEDKVEINNNTPSTSTALPGLDLNSLLERMAAMEQALYQEKLTREEQQQVQAAEKLQLELQLQTLEATSAQERLELVEQVNRQKAQVQLLEQRVQVLEEQNTSEIQQQQLDQHKEEVRREVQGDLEAQRQQQTLEVAAVQDRLELVEQLHQQRVQGLEEEQTKQHADLQQQLMDQSQQQQGDSEFQLQLDAQKEQIEQLQAQNQQLQKDLEEEQAMRQEQDTIIRKLRPTLEGQLHEGFQSVIGFMKGELTKISKKAAKSHKAPSRNLSGETATTADADDSIMGRVVMEEDNESDSITEDDVTLSCLPCNNNDSSASDELSVFHLMHGCDPSRCKHAVGMGPVVEDPLPRRRSSLPDQDRKQKRPSLMQRLSSRRRSTTSESWGSTTKLNASPPGLNDSAHWKSFVAEDNRIYYHNELTGKSQWELPGLSYN